MEYSRQTTLKDYSYKRNRPNNRDNEEPPCIKDNPGHSDTKNYSYKDESCQNEPKWRIITKEDEKKETKRMQKLTRLL